jgi:polyisoprenoid-binding protein YceI
MRFLLVFSMAASLVRGATPATVDLAAGTANFVVPTSIPAVIVHGKSKAFTAAAKIRQQDKSLVVEQLQAKLPIHSLSTGMAVRDNHMRKLIFTASDGTTPDLVFQAGRTECGSEGADFVCQVQGELSIRGLGRPFTAALKVRGDGSGKFRGTGDGSVRLSDYGIEPPSQLGIRVGDQVQIRFEFTATANNPITSDVGRE